MRQLNQRRNRARLKEGSCSIHKYLQPGRAARTAARILSAAAVMGVAGATFGADLFVPNVLKRDLYYGATRQQLEAGVTNAPSSVDFLDSFQTTDFADSYAQRISGVFIPPATGDYIFFVSSDDDSDLFLSTDATPANKRLIATENAWSTARQWTSSAGGSVAAQKRSDQFSPDSGVTHPYANGIHLTAGQRYYIEGVHHEGAGGDNFGATYTLAGQGDPADGDDSQLSAVNNNIGVVLKVPTQVNVSISPRNLSSFAGGYVQLQGTLQADTDDAAVYQWRRNGVNIPGATNANYAFIAGANDANATYELRAGFQHVTNVVTSAAAKLTFRNDAIVKAGTLKNQVWFGAVRADVEAGKAGTPAQVSTLPSFEAPVNERDAFARRISGWFTPEVTGDYVFFLCSDDDSDLFLSTDENPSNIRQIAAETAWSDNLSWTSSGGGSDLAQKRSDQFSPDQGATVPFANGIHLVAGQKYFIEGVEHEGNGGDNLSATYKLISDADPADGTPTLLTNGVISSATTPITLFTITNQVQNLTTNEDRTAVFSVGLSTDSEMTPVYQWRRNGTNIPGAVSSSYSFTARQSDNNAMFDVVAGIPSDPSRTLTSSVAKLTVISSAIVPGYLKREYFPNESRQTVEAGTTVNLPETSYITGWDLGTVADNYAQRISGYFIAPTNGNYVFFIASDDDSDLFLSTDEDPANKVLIAHEDSWSNQRTWLTAGGGTSTAEQKRSDSFTPDNGVTYPGAGGIPLTAGKRYYIEGVHHEGTGGDSFGVTYKLYDDLDPADGDATRMTGSVIAALLPKPERFEITGQPQSTSAAAGTPFTITADFDTDAFIAPAFQWRRNGVAITDANGGPVFTKIASAADNGASYDVVVTMPGFTNTVISSAATLTVTASTNIVTGSLYREVFTNSFGSRASFEAGTANSLAAADAGTYTNLLIRFQAPSDFGDHYLQRVSGLFIPDTTGDYVFFICSDDDSDLFLSTDESPANKRLIARESGWSAAQLWVTDSGNDPASKRSDQYSPDGGNTIPFANGIHLVAGQKYYIEADHHEVDGGDNLGVTFKLITEEDPADGTPSRLTGNLIAHVASTGSTAGGGQPEITVTRSGTGLSISWTNGGTLEATDDLGSGAVWTDVTSTSPASVTPSQAHRFFRVRK